MPRVHNSRSRRPRKPRQNRENSRRKAPQQERSRTMVEDIMRAAARVLVRDGYDAFTTNRVADVAGVSVGSLYQYFSSKQQLVGALLERHVDHTLQKMRDAIPELMALPVEAAVRRFIQLMLAAHAYEPELHRVFNEQLPRIADFALVESSLTEGIALAEAYLRAHAGELSPQNHALSAFMLVGTVEALTHAAVLSRPELLTSEEFLDQLTAMTVGYLIH